MQRMLVQTLGGTVEVEGLGPGLGGFLVQFGQANGLLLARERWERLTFEPPIIEATRNGICVPLMVFNCIVDTAGSNATVCLRFKSVALFYFPRGREWGLGNASCSGNADFANVSICNEPLGLEDLTRNAQA